jgi:hemoglobin
MPKHPTVTEDGIAELVDTFYARIRTDPVLGPVFEGKIAPDAWPKHLATMKRFWSSVMLTSGAYSGNPVGVHRGVPGLERPMFARRGPVRARTRGRIRGEGNADRWKP